MTFLISFLVAGLITSCAASILIPAELRDARQAYARASATPAAQLVPADMHKAREALVRAEKSFRDDPTSYRTQDLANLAYREAKKAEALATSASDRANISRTGGDLPSTTTENVKQQWKVTDDGKKIASEPKVGDKVLYGKYWGTEVTIGGDEYLIVRVADVFASV